MACGPHRMVGKPSTLGNWPLGLLHVRLLLVSKGERLCVMRLTFEGEPSSLQEIAKALAKVWLVNIRGTLGPDPGDDKEISI